MKKVSLILSVILLAAMVVPFSNATTERKAENRVISYKQIDYKSQNKTILPKEYLGEWSNNSDMSLCGTGMCFEIYEMMMEIYH